MNLKARLNIIESALMPTEEKRLIVHSTIAFCEMPVIGWRGMDKTIYSVDDSRIDDLKGFQWLQAIYDDDELTD
jgi:hypothetical protein